jgi:hypothetical protein
MWAELSVAGVDLIGARRLGPLVRHLRRVAPAGPQPAPGAVLLRTAAPTRPA